MIGLLIGVIADVENAGDNRITLLLSVSGVGYEVRVTQRGLDKLGASDAQPVVIYTHQRVREDALELFGFATKQDRDLFRLLLTVNNVGPQVALSLLQAMDYPVLAQAIASGNANELGKAPGVGVKTAQKIVFELEGKFAAFMQGVQTEHIADDATALKSTVQQTLDALGYGKTEVQSVLEALGKDPQLKAETDPQQWLVRALTWLETH